MDFVFWGLVLLVCVVMRYVASWVIRYLSEKENDSEFFQEAVGTDYKLEFPDKEWEQYVVIKKKIQEKHLGEKEADEEDSWMKGLSEQEKKVCLLSLRNCMIKSVNGLAQIQKDRPGTYRLWRTKLISEAYWESLQECEKEVQSDINDTMKEATRLAPAAYVAQHGNASSFGDTFFDECVNMWRQQQHEREQEEAKVRAVEQRKEVAKQKVHLEKVAEQKAAADVLRAEKERERIAQSLIMEEEIETKKSQKTRNRKPAKKK